MRLKGFLFLAAGAAGVAAYVKSRGGEQLEEVAPQVREAATKVGQVVPDSVKQAATTAVETVQRAIPTEDGGEQGGERYEPPVEAGSQPPAVYSLFLQPVPVRPPTAIAVKAAF